jgi:hypothetical protein
MGMGKTVQILALIIYIKITISNQSLLKLNSNSSNAFPMDQSINNKQISQEISKERNEFSDLKEYASQKEKLRKKIIRNEDDFDINSYRNEEFMIDMEFEDADINQDFPCVCGRKTLVVGDIDWVC